MNKMIARVRPDLREQGLYPFITMQGEERVDYDIDDYWTCYQPDERDHYELNLILIDKKGIILLANSIDFYFEEVNI
jgi:hypothetical protein